MIKQQPSTIKTQGKMLQHGVSLSFHVFCHMLFISADYTAADYTAADYIYVECSGAYFTRLTPCETNVNSLFSSLVNSASVTNFNKFEISETNVVYGLYQCRGDLESSKCKDCVASSVNQLKTACPLSVGGSIQLDGCFLKYDNNPFFGVKSTVEVKKRCGPSIGYNTDILYNRDDALVNLMAGNGKYFHGGDYGSIRGVAQCVQDLSLSDCQDCLYEASGRLRSQCETSSWGDMFLEKCYIRYDDQDIGHSSNNNSKDDGGGNNSKLITEIIEVILAILGAASLTIIIKNNNCCTTIKSEDNMEENAGKDLKVNTLTAANDVALSVSTDRLNHSGVVGTGEVIKVMPKLPELEEGDVKDPETNISVANNDVALCQGNDPMITVSSSSTLSDNQSSGEDTKKMPIVLETEDNAGKDLGMHQLEAVNNNGLSSGHGNETSSELIGAVEIDADKPGSEEKNKRQEGEEGAKKQEKNKKQEGEEGAKKQEKNKKEEGEEGAKKQEKNKKKEGEEGAKQQEKNKKQEGAKKQEKNRKQEGAKKQEKNKKEQQEKNKEEGEEGAKQQEKNKKQQV